MFGRTPKSSRWLFLVALMMSLVTSSWAGPKRAPKPVEKQPEKTESIHLRILKADPSDSLLEPVKDVSLTRKQGEREFKGTFILRAAGDGPVWWKLQLEDQTKVADLRLNGPGNAELELDKEHKIAGKSAQIAVSYTGLSLDDLNLRLSASASQSQGLPASSGGDEKESSNKSGITDLLLDHLYLALGATFLILGGLAGYFIWSSKKSKDDYHGGRGNVPNPRIAEIQGSIVRPVPPVASVREPDAIAKVKQDLDSLAERLDSLRKEAATQADLVQLQDVMGQVRQDIIDVAREGAANLQELDKLRSAFEQVRSAGNSYWQCLFSEASLQNPKFQKDAKEAQDKLVSFFRAGVPKGDGLGGVSERCRALYLGLRGTLDLARKSGAANSILPQLATLEEASRDLCQETDTMIASLRERRLSLRFSCDLQAHEAARADIFDSLAEGLTREVAKWQDPSTYLASRLQDFGLMAAPLAADLCDKELDQQRVDQQLQDLLQSIIATSGLQEIPVRLRDPLQPQNHLVVQLTPGRTAQDRSQTIAQVVARGFLRDNQVHRKASVVVYR